MSKEGNEGGESCVIECLCGSQVRWAEIWFLKGYPIAKDELLGY